MSLEPHHVFGVEPPTLLLQRLSSQILCLGALHVVENEEERLRGQPLEEVDGVAARGRGLGVVGGRVTRVPRQVGSQSLGVARVRQMVRCRLQHAATCKLLVMTWTYWMLHCTRQTHHLAWLACATKCYLSLLAHLYWNWCSLLRGTMPRGATPSSGGMCASFLCCCCSLCRSSSR